MSDTPKGHPKGLYVLFVTEMAERFSYYGMRAIFILYLTKALLISKSVASNNFYGTYTSLVYLTPLLGGYIADRYWGNRKSIIVGGFLMAIGQFMMFLSGSFYQQQGLSTIIMVVGLGFLIFGNGFFKPNISTMVGQLYSPGDVRIDSAFTIFYMGINLGAFFSPLVCGALGDTGNSGDFKWGFLAACVGMLLSTIMFMWLKDHYIVTPEGKAIGAKPEKKSIPVSDSNEPIKKDISSGQLVFWAGVEIVLFLIFMFLVKFDFFGSLIFSLAIAVPGLIISDRSLSKIERQRIWVIYIAAFFVIFFWSAFEQAGASLTFFAEEQTDRTVGATISALVARIGLGVIAAYLSWLTVRMFKKLNKEQKGVRELIVGLLVLTVGFCIYGLVKIPSAGILIDEIPASFFQSINAVAIVIFAPIFAMLWQFLGKKKMEPASPYKQSYGLLLLAIGYLVIAIGVKTLPIGMKASMFWITTLYIIHTFGELCLSPIGLSMVNKLAPLKFASLLMGVWFLANATANKFAGMLSALYPEDVHLAYVLVAKDIKVTLHEAHDTIPAVIYHAKNDSAWVMDNLKPAKAELATGFTSVSAKPGDTAYVLKAATHGTWVLDTVPAKDSLFALKYKYGERNDSIPQFKLKQILSNYSDNVRMSFTSDGKSFAVWTKGKIDLWNLNPDKPKFIVWPIKNLYDFFMLFVYLAGAASVALFFLSRKMVKMMNGIR